ncbi:tas protein [Spatholobus suberectus]|nr:tas protein [Spatholobus suberectus]
MDTSIVDTSIASRKRKRDEEEEEEELEQMKLSNVKMKSMGKRKMISKDKKEDTRSYFSWNLEMECVLAEVLRDQRNLDNKGDRNGKVVAYNTATQVLSKHFRVHLIGDNCKEIHGYGLKIICRDVFYKSIVAALLTLGKRLGPRLLGRVDDSRDKLKHGLSQFLPCFFFSSPCDNLFLSHPLKPSLPLTNSFTLPRNRKKSGASVRPLSCALNNAALQFRKLGDSDLNISEITLGTVSYVFLSIRFHVKRRYHSFVSIVRFPFWLVRRWFQMTFGEQNAEKEAHDILNYAFDRGINALDTAEAYPIPMKKETQGRTDLYIGSWLKSQPRDKIILATKVCGYSERSSYLRDNANVLRVDAANIKESVEKSLKRLGTDYIDLLQIHWPDRYVPLFGEFSYDPSKWRPSVPFVEQLQAFQELINEGKVRYIGVSNETSYGVMEFVHAAKVEGLPKIVSIQNSYSLLARCRFEVDLVEACHPKNCNIGLLAYSPLGGGSLTGKYIDINSEAAKRGRLNLFPGYMERYNKSLAREATLKYLELAKKHGLTPVQLALGFARDRPFMTSSIIGATSVDQLKEDIDAFTKTERPLPAEVMADIEAVFKRYKDPTIL